MAEVKPSHRIKTIAYNSIKEMIINNEIESGEFIVESELQEKLAIGRTPIREALLKLADEQFVTIFPRKGIICTPVTIELVNNIYQIRYMIEPEIIKSNSSRFDKDYLSSLKKRVLALDVYGEDVDVNKKAKNEAIKLDNEFHSYIYQNCNNSTLVKIMNNIFDHDKRIRVLTHDVKGRFYTSNREHNQILNYLLDDDYNEAAKAMKSHILNSRQYSLDIENIGAR